MITGSVAGMFYGEPRLTNDVDIIVMLTDEATRVFPVLYPETSYYCPPQEVLTVEARRRSRGHFNVIHMESGSKADFYIAYNPLHQWGMAHKQLIQIEDSPIWIAPPEYVILRKLEFHREGGSEKHLTDITGMLEISGSGIDTTIISDWCQKLGLEAQWQAALKRQ
jgi:hypothetical protein